MEDTPIIHAGISNSNCDRAGNTIRQFIKWEKIAKGREEKKKKLEKGLIVTFQVMVFYKNFDPLLFSLFLFRSPRKDKQRDKRDQH